MLKVFISILYVVKDTTADLIFKPLNSLTTLNYNNSDDDNNRNCCNNSDNDSNNNNESEFTLYCNTPWYAFFRLFQVLITINLII
jgi:hypothetical protein